MTAELVTDPSVRAAYSADSSGLVMLADYVARPTSAGELVDLLHHATTDRIPVTPAGSQTSTTASSITNEGMLLSVRGLSRILDLDTGRRRIRVEAGALLGDVKRLAASEGLLFPPDPTSEEDSTIGGAIACNASGARSLKYGATRQHISWLKVALASGEIAEFRRPQLEKNTVGYGFAQDPLDWFVGSEGTLGVIVEAELALLPLPPEVIGFAFPFASESAALSFIIAAREETSVDARCLEYFDRAAFEIARTADDQTDWAKDANSMVYVEQEGANGLDGALENWVALAERFKGDGDTRVFQGEAHLRQARRMRHRVPATMNERGARHRLKGGRKVSTDWAVPYRCLKEAVEAARQISGKAGIPEPVMYGHAGNGHPHQNFIARNAAEVQTIERVVEETLRMVIGMGGTVAAEHGIGKLKQRWVNLQMRQIQIDVMRAVKRQLDPLNLLGRGNIV